MAGKKSAEKELHWRKMVKGQADSGLSVRAFCASEGISEPSFYAWRKKLRERKVDGRRPRKSRHPDDRSPRGRNAADAPDNEHLFVPLKLLDTPAGLEIVHPLGYRVQVTGDVNAGTLRNVIEVLDERGER